MPEELFRSDLSSVQEGVTLTRTVVRQDDGSVIVTQRDTRVINGQNTNIMEAVVQFGADEWATAIGAGFTPPVKRIVSTRVYIRRFTQAEKEALEEVAEATTQNGRRMRAIFRELAADNTIDLDNQSLVDALTLFIKPVLVAKGVWASNAVADGRIAVIRGLA